MPRFIATYDLKDDYSPHDEFTEAAIKKGWELWVASGDQLYRLPNTTLVGTFDDQDAAVAAFKAVKPLAEKELGHNITVEKWFLALYSTATFVSDEKRKKS